MYVLCVVSYSKITLTVIIIHLSFVRSFPQFELHIGIVSVDSILVPIRILNCIIIHLPTTHIIVV